MNNSQNDLVSAEMKLIHSVVQFYEAIGSDQMAKRLRKMLHEMNEETKEVQNGPNETERQISER